MIWHTSGYGMESCTNEDKLVKYDTQMRKQFCSLRKSDIFDKYGVLSWYYRDNYCKVNTE